MKELRRIRAIVAVAEDLHFGRAAIRLGMAQPPLSQLIRAFETELGGKLFERTNRQVALTPAGEALLPEARALLAQAERAMDVARRTLRGELGELRIGFTGSAAFGSVIPRIVLVTRRENPGIHLRLQELTTADQLAALVERRLDIGFVRNPSEPSLPPQLQAVRLLADELWAVLPPGHALAVEDGPLDVGALAGEDFIMYPRQSGTGVYDQIMDLSRAAGFVPRVAQEAREVATIVGLVGAGLGVSLVPASLRSLSVNGVTYRPLIQPAARSALWLVMKAHGLSAQERAFLKLARQVSKGALGCE